MGIQKKNFEVISSSRHIKMACTKCLKFSFTMLCKDQSKLEHDEIREKLSKMEKTMNHFEEIGAKIEEKVDEAISKKLESLELIQSITKKLEKLPAELQNKIETIPKHIDNSYSKVLQRNMEEHKEENIIKSVGDIVEEAMNKNKKEDEIKRSVIIHKLEETHMNNFDDRMKADMNKLSELMEEGVKIQMPEITKIHRIGKYNPDNNGKYRQIKVVFKDNITRYKVLRNASNLKQADDKYKHCYIRNDLNQDERKEFTNKMEKAQELNNKEENNNKFFCGKRLPIKLENSPRRK